MLAVVALATTVATAWPVRIQIAGGLWRNRRASDTMTTAGRSIIAVDRSPRRSNRHAEDQDQDGQRV